MHSNPKCCGWHEQKTYIHLYTYIYVYMIAWSSSLLDKSQKWWICDGRRCDMGWMGDEWVNVWLQHAERGRGSWLNEDGMHPWWGRWSGEGCWGEMRVRMRGGGGSSGGRGEESKKTQTMTTQNNENQKSKHIWLDLFRILLVQQVSGWFGPEICEIQHL